MNELYEEFKGFKVWDVVREEDKVILEGADQVDIVIEPRGDCCSITWIESIDLVGPLVCGAIIQNIEDIEMPSLGNKGTLNHTRVDQVTYYGLKITTNKGISILDYRNDSNGYYGGEVMLYKRDRKTGGKV